MNSPLVLPEDISEEDLNVSFSLSKRKTVNKIFVNISGNFTIKHVESISDAMQLVINQYDQVALKVHDVQQIDLTAVQLLYNCLKKGEHISLEVDLPPIVRQLLSITGLSEIFQRPKPSLPLA
ncbi:MAG: hypothetical protein CMP48_11630 [Rickettsiales bacterium]|nr:hypothetical protein [Rickettsiales bacterium]